MLFFKTRKEAREFAARSVKASFFDRGVRAPFGRRWAAKFL